jgi:hypothetical protein
MRSLRVPFLVLVANSAYLWATADPTLFYFGNLVLHLVLGTVLALVAGVHAAREGRSWPGSLKGAGLLLAAGTVAGLVLAAVGNTRANRWLLVTHIVTSVLGALVVLLWMALNRRRPAPGWNLARTLVALAAVAIAASGVSRAGGRNGTGRIANPIRPPLNMEGEGSGPESPFFPSSAETNVGGTIPSNFFMTSQVCGKCHKDIYDQWNSSAHHFSSFNNQWYRKSIEYMQDVVGTKPSKWCAGCHDHAVFFNGRFDRPIKEQIDTPEAQAGLSCTSCHSITHVKSTMGQGDFTIEYPPLHDLAASENPVLSKVHDFLLYADPEPHRRTFLKPFHRE